MAFVDTSKSHVFHCTSHECLAKGLSTDTHLPADVHMGSDQQEAQSISDPGCTCLIADDVPQVKDANSAKNEKDFTNYRIAASS